MFGLKVRLQPILLYKIVLRIKGNGLYKGSGIGMSSAATLDYVFLSALPYCCHHMNLKPTFGKNGVSLCSRPMLYNVTHSLFASAADFFTLSLSLAHSVVVLKCERKVQPTLSPASQKQ